MPTVLVLDLGSSSTRAMLFDDAANLVPGSIFRRAHQFQADAHGANTDDPEALFERALGVLDDAVAFASARGLRITDLGVSAYASSCVIVDERAEPLTPVYTYADTTAAADAQALRGQYDELEALQRTGCRVRANYLPARIQWLKRLRPDVWRQARWCLSASDFILGRVLGSARVGISVASWTGLLNRRKGGWDETWRMALELPAGFCPPIMARGETRQAALLPDYAKRWPGLRDARWHAPVGDGAAANIGSGCDTPDRIAVTIGTTAAMRIVRPLPAQPAPLPAATWGYRVDHDRELVGGATTEGGNVFGWLTQTLRLDSGPAADLEAVLRGEPPDGHGLTMVPTFAGERSPGYAEDIAATIDGLRLSTTPAQLLRSGVESVAYRLGIIFDQLRPSASPGAALVASGGALVASPEWCQILSDVAGAAVWMCDEAEASAKGVALLALGRTARDVPPRLTRVFEPDVPRGAIYRAAMARQDDLYRRLRRLG